MNRFITRLILVFVVGSLAVCVIPLLTSGGDAPLLAFADRSKSHGFYGAFLVVFLAIIFPGFLVRSGDERCQIPWAFSIGYVLLFAAIPLLFTAYISGVTARGMVSVAAIAATAAGAMLLLRRVFRRHVGFAAWPLAVGTLFVLPAVMLVLESFGRTPPELLRVASPLTWIHRIARLREVPDPTPIVLAALILWGLALVPLRRRGAAVAVLLLSVGLLVGAGAPRFQQRLVLESALGDVARAGFRLPLWITAPAGERVRVSVGGWAEEFVGTGAPELILPIPAPSDRYLEARLSSGVETHPLPTLADAEVFLVGLLSDARLPDVGERSVKTHRFADGRLPTALGALEAFDVLVVSRRAWASATDSVRLVLENYAALGGVLVVQDEGVRAAEAAPLGTGTRFVAGSTTPLVAFVDRRSSIEGGAINAGFRTTFAPPDWQEMDLSQLLLFAIVYHVAFLLAFLLPLLLDSRKSVTVYIASVGFVVLVVVLLAYNVLGRIFLKDNQVYSQSIAMVVADGEGDGPTVLRQFLCFASMSAETRDLEFDQTNGAIARYRGPDERAVIVRQRTATGVTLAGVSLDRFQGKALVRRDVVSGPALKLQRLTGGGFGLDLTPGAAAIGLEKAHAVGGLVVRDGRFVARLKVAGNRLLPDGEDSGAIIPRETEVLFRKMVGHFAPRLRHFLIVRYLGLPRPDPFNRYLWTADLGSYLLVPL